MYYSFKYGSFLIIATLCLISFFLKKGILEARTIKENNIVIIYKKCISLLDKYWYIALFAIFAVFLFTRLYALNIVPVGVHVDEIGYWYDAENLAKYGTDRMGNRYPWLPAAYGDGSNPLYTYMCMIALKFFPFSIKLMRAIMAVSSIPCFFASFGIVYQLYENRRFALLGPILVTITPYVFAANRWGLNANQMLYVGTVVLYFLIKALKYNKTRDYILVGSFLGISLLTYTLSYIMMPLFFILTFIYLIIVKDFRWKNAFATFIPFAIIGTPSFLEQLVNMGLIKPFYFLGSDYYKLSIYRIGDMSPMNIVKNIGNIITLVFGDNEYNYNSVKEFGTLYWASIPLLVVGTLIGFITLYKSIKNKKINVFVPIMLYGFSVYFGFLFDSGCNAYKANAIYIVFILLIIAGIRYMSGYSVDECVYISDKYTSISSTNSDSCISSEHVIKKSFVVITLFVLALNFLLYTEFYFRKMNYTYGYLSLFLSTVTGDMVKYEETLYNPNGDKSVYMELNYENREFSNWMTALYTETKPDVFTAYEETKHNAPEEEKNSIIMDHFAFAFPAEFDENEDAVYILGNNWDHISSYLIDIGFNCDATFPGYKILYR